MGSGMNSENPSGPILAHSGTCKYVQCLCGLVCTYKHIQSKFHIPHYLNEYL